MKAEEGYALCMIIAVVSFLGFVVENVWLCMTKGYIDNRSMCLPFLLGYGLAVIAIFSVVESSGTPGDGMLSDGAVICGLSVQPVPDVCKESTAAEMGNWYNGNKAVPDRTENSGIKVYVTSPVFKCKKIGRRIVPLPILCYNWIDVKASSQGESYDEFVHL